MKTPSTMLKATAPIDTNPILFELGVFAK